MGGRGGGGLKRVTLQEFRDCSARLCEILVFQDGVFMGALSEEVAL